MAVTTWETNSFSGGGAVETRTEPRALKKWYGIIYESQGTGNLFQSIRVNDSVGILLWLCHKQVF